MPASTQSSRKPKSSQTRSGKTPAPAAPTSHEVNDIFMAEGTSPRYDEAVRAHQAANQQAAS
jgi:hypothetical protein